MSPPNPVQADPGVNGGHDGHVGHPASARLQGGAACRIYTSGMAGEVSGIILVGAFGAVTALCAFLIPKLYRVGTSRKTPPPPRGN